MNANATIIKKVVFPAIKSGVFLTITSNSFEINCCLFNKSTFGFWVCLPFVSIRLSLFKSFSFKIY